ncbi:MAG: tRNA (N6-isopentenyl adenosine(37)-C2)-methylthiotransferase MiaB [Geobacteraceae bacterium]|nr:tRNA (N6-isopentenyl adenosine(37)-C2)-methylthiotransferase MiaB [Geobacteraceae bacterium]
MNNIKKLYIETFGCQMNVNDSATMVSLLKDLDYEQTDSAAGADLILLNTCCIRAKAEQKVFSELGRLKSLKNEKKKVLLGVGGCIAQQEGDRLLKRIPYLDLVVGTHSLHLLPDMVRAAEKGERLTRNDFLDPETRLDLFPRKEAAGGVARFVTVIQGCDNFCSYCIVPFVRGREVSRRSGEILQEIRELSEIGVREVTLLGQNVNSYGIKSPEEPSFAELLRRVAEIDGIERIRFTTSHPKDISPDLIACFAELPRLCSHIHLPAQSGSDRVLKAMNRGYTRREYLDRIAALKIARPDITITGDMIVGFPGETAEDFEETLSLMEEVGFADLFSFVFSARPETAAAKLADTLTRKERQERLDSLQHRQHIMTRERNNSLQGSIQEVLVEGVSRRGDQLFGRTSGNRITNISADPSLIGKLVTVRIVEAFQNSLLGEIV